MEQTALPPSFVWQLVRLELARTAEFPDGSPGHAYLLRLPLDQNGIIDAEALARDPALATVRRFWPNEPDHQGYVVRTQDGWAFSYALGEEDDERLFHLESHPFRLGNYITLTEPDGRRLPYRVAHTEPDGTGGRSSA